MTLIPSDAYVSPVSEEDRRKEGMQRGYNAAARLAIAFDGVIVSEDINDPL